MLFPELAKLFQDQVIIKILQQESLNKVQFQLQEFKEFKKQLVEWLMMKMMCLKNLIDFLVKHKKN